MKTTKKLLLIGLTLAVLMGLASVFTVGTAAAEPDAAAVVNNLVLNNVVIGQTKCGDEITVNVAETAAKLDAAGYTMKTAGGEISFAEATDLAMTITVDNNPMVWPGTAGEYVTAGNTSVSLSGAVFNATASNATGFEVELAAGQNAVAGVTPAVITLDVADFTVALKTFDGTTAAEVAYVGNALPAGATLTITNANFNSPNVDEADEVKFDVALDAETAKSYELADTTLAVPATIAKAELVLNATDFVVEPKTYDGTTTAEVTYVGTALPAGATLSVTANFNSADVKTAVEVSATVALDVVTAENYELAVSEFTFDADIEKKEITLDEASFVIGSKTYDGSASAAGLVSYTGALENGVTLVFSAETFNSKNVVEVTKVTFTVALDALSAENYVLTETDFELDATGKITPIRVNVSGIKFLNKVYDGTTNVTLSSNESITISNVLAGEKLAVEVYNTSAETANVGNDIKINYEYKLVADDANTLETNYEIDDHSKEMCSIEITALKVTVLVDNVTYSYGDAAVEYTYTTKQTISTEAAATLAKIIKITSEYTAESTVGTYPITATVDETVVEDGYTLADNFEITVVNATATVEIKTIYVSITVPESFIYGTATDTLEIVVTDDAGADVTDTVADGVLTVEAYSGETKMEGILPVGTYKVTVALNDTENYEIVVSENTLAVEKATLTVKIDTADTTTVYGSVAPEYTIVVEGFVNGEDESLIPEYSWKNISVSTEYKQGSPVGEYAFTRTGSFYNLANYEFDYTAVDAAKLTVTAKKITVTANDLTVSYGQGLTGATFADVAEQLYGTDTFDATRVTFEAWLVDAEGNKLTKRELNSVVTAKLAEGQSYKIYPVVAALTEGTDNYTYEVVAGTLTVNKLVINVSALAEVKIPFYTAAPAVPTNPFEGYASLPESDLANIVFTYYTDLEKKTEYKIGDHVGTYSYTVSIATASDNYEIVLAEGLVGKLTVEAAELTVTVNTVTTTYGETVTYAYTAQTLPADVKVTFVNDGAVYTVYSGETVVTGRLGAGTYTVKLSGIVLDGDNKGDYTVKYVAGTHTVNKKALNVGFAVADTNYGSAADLTPIYTPAEGVIVEGDTWAAILAELGTVSVTTTYKTGDNVGNYVLTVTVEEGKAAANYDVTFTAAAHKVVAVKLTVTFPNQSIEYGDAVPNYTADAWKGTITGFVNGDELEKLVESGALVVGTATTEYAQGKTDTTYTITGTGFSATNYTFEYVGTLTVTPRTIKIVVGDYTGTTVYGEAFTKDVNVILGLISEYVAEGATSKLYGTDTLANAEIFKVTPNTAYVAGNTVGEYTYTITVESPNYSVIYVNADGTAGDNVGKFTVSKRALTYNLYNATVLYGEAADYSGVVEWVGFLTGDSYEEELVSGVLTVRATGYGAGSLVGTYNITVAMTGLVFTNYELVENDQAIKPVLTVNKRNITILIDDETVTYGDPAPEFNVTIGGDKLASFDTVEKLFGTFTFVTDYGVGTSVGTYTVAVNGCTNILMLIGANSNYEVDTSTAYATITVTPKTLYVVPSQTVKLESETNPAIGYTWYGNLEGENPSFVGALATETTSGVGKYDVTIGTLALADNVPFYAENYVLELVEFEDKFSIIKDQFIVKFAGGTLDLREFVYLAYGVTVSGESFLAEGVTVIETGILQWTESEYAKLNSYDYNEIYAFNTATGATADGSTKVFRGNSVSATKYMDTYYARAYAKLSDGTYVYSDVVEHSVVGYAKKLLATNDGYKAEKPVVIAMLDYGTAVMTFRGMTENGLPSDIVTDAMRREFGAVGYNGEMKNAALDAIAALDKYELAGAISDRITLYGASTTLHGAINLNFNANNVELEEGEKVYMIYWAASALTEESFDENGKLLAAKGTKEDAYKTAAGYVASVESIAAKNADEAYYAVMCIEDAEGNVEYSAVQVISVNAYAAKVIDSNSGADVIEVAKAMLAYTNAADLYSNKK